jgi:valyl-tRNA synthetase
VSEELGKTYQPAAIEKRWYELWEESGYFHVPASDSREPFTIVIPPPNVTGSLHMGHALDNTLQDILARYKRMDGFATLWLPGTDHAGIATQMVVEKLLAKEGIKRQELGREKFVARVWQWKAESGGKIVHQLRRLGASCDWTRERFTLDEGLSRAVRHVFVTLYNEGLIYRSAYLISWCPRCHTALSDLEVEHHDVDGELTYFRYPTADGKSITVATTRPETMLGDTAIAVHPDDARYKKQVGQTVKHPFLNRSFAIIADAFVDPKFGTGAVKITPAHDPNDYEMGKRHNLQFITVLDEEGKVNEEGGPYQGLDRFKARKKIVEDLKDQGLLEKVEPHRHAVGHCQRCGTIVEPRVSEQWFVKIAPLAKPAAEAVRHGKTKFVPENWTNTYLKWMDGIRDWCISRQLWWGHQIPVWYCGSCNKQTVAVEAPADCSHCHSKDITQDPDVLDTWFSSALWPFSTLGWPEKTPDLQKFYPTSVLVTGFDIIFFWVARMMMMGIKFMKEPPFGTVHIHALVRDEKGQKMSKSKGNVVDPLEIMDRYGTDAFRFALTAFAIQGRDISLSEKRIEGYRNFMTKLWNASRFALTALGSEKLPSQVAEPKTLANRWLRSRLNEVTKSVRTGFDEMRFSESAEALYHFIWHEFCDWYLELIKPAVYAEKKDSETLETLAYVLDRVLRLLHPIAPFITEEIWHRLPTEKRSPSIMLADFPKADGYTDDQAVETLGKIQKVVEGIRNIRSENRINPSLKIKVLMSLVEGKPAAWMKTVEEHEALIRLLAGVSEIEFQTKNFPKPSALGIVGDLEIRVPLAGLVDTEEEKKRLEKEHSKLLKDIDFLQKRLDDPNYSKKAPPQLIEKDRAKLSDARANLERIDRSMKGL